MGTVCSKPVGFELTERESKRCVVLGESQLRVVKRRNNLNFPIVRAEYVIHVRLEKSFRDQDPLNAANDQVCRALRTAILTRGTVHLVAPPTFTPVAACCPGVMHADLVRDYPNILFPIRDLRVIAFDKAKNLVVIAADSSEIVMYQTPEPFRFLEALSPVVVAAFAGIPDWAVPIRWNLGVSLPPVPPNIYKQAMGIDGGFSSAYFAAAFAVIAGFNLTGNLYNKGPRSITHVIMKRQPSFPFKRHAPYVLNAGLLVEDLIGTSCQTGASQIAGPLIIEALNCLPFNLVFRSLRINTDICRGEKFQNSLSRVLLYNVTLRELDLAGCNLEGCGEEMGRSLAMNVRPLISRLDVSACHLSDRDFRGLVQGLVRLWCTGSALPESISVAKNPNVTNDTWNLLFDALVDPSSFPLWPSSPPPPPSLVYLQHLNVLETTAPGKGLARIVTKLSGLRSLAIGSANGNNEGVDLVLQALGDLDAPLESFFGLCMTSNCVPVLFTHCSTLKSVTLESFIGDATPLLCTWPEPVPTLSVEFKGSGAKQFTSSPDITSTSGNSPGSLTLRNDKHDFCRRALLVLGKQATGLTSLYVHGMHYSGASEAVPVLAHCGLKTLHITWPATGANIRVRDWERSRSFWSNLAASKTLYDLQIPNQLTSPDELIMIGKFLRANRSVRNIGFDGSRFTLTVEGVKALRSAFYGNKKVIAMEFPKQAKAETMKQYRSETDRCFSEVQKCKAQIKILFQSSYSKYDLNWRAKPNRLKLPYVERIRVAKRKMGKIRRDTDKIVRLLTEIKQCTAVNRVNYDKVVKQKQQIKLDRKKQQLENIALKKQRVITELMTTTHKAKKRSGKHSSFQNQVPRSAYYRNRNFWPSKRYWKATDRSVPNDSLYWRDRHHIRWHPYMWMCLYDDEDFEREPDIGALPPYVVDPESETVLGGIPDTALGSEEDTSWEGLLSAGENFEATAPQDPWTEMDALVTGAGSNLGAVVSPEYLSEIHMQASELGPDVLSAFAATLDRGATIDEKLNAMANSTDMGRSMLEGRVDSVMQNLDPEQIVGDVAVGGDLAAGDQTEGDLLAEADAAVEMYAGAGPRDLDDGGPSLGRSGFGVLAGARRRARQRKPLRRYMNLHLTTSPCDMSLSGTCFEPWENDLLEAWKEEVTSTQIDVMSKSDLFSLPDVANVAPKRILEWTERSSSMQGSCSSVSDPPIEVTLVTQCSLDRLMNLQEQLSAWKGKASVTVYVKYDADVNAAEDTIMSYIHEAKRCAFESTVGASHWDIAVTLVQGAREGEPYPINFLRNAALLEARYQQLQRGTPPERSAVLLVDVDFRPSRNLHDALHCPAAAAAILDKRRVVICPAFEDSADVKGPAKTISELKSRVDDGLAEGFHLSHFPQGHSPTRFDQFWAFSSVDAPVEGLWEKAYSVAFEQLFEPYVVMAAEDVSLYDERFQGYGLNKVSHLASIANHKSKDFYVLPGVFLVAPMHERSESWKRIYGSNTDEANFRKLWLKGLYRNFSVRLKEGKSPIVSPVTKIFADDLAAQARASKTRVQSKELVLRPSTTFRAEEDVWRLLLCSSLAKCHPVAGQKHVLLRVEGSRGVPILTFSI